MDWPARLAQARERLPTPHSLPKTPERHHSRIAKSRRALSAEHLLRSYQSPTSAIRASNPHEPSLHLNPVTSPPVARHATPNQARSQPVRLGKHRLPLRLRKMPPGQPIRADAEGGLRFRVQDLYPALHHLQVEGRPHLAPEAHRHLPHMRAPEELLPVLHARPFIWSTHRRQRCRP